jgi:hypothetical protein
MRSALVITAVVGLAFAGAAYLLGFAMDQAWGARLPRHVGAASLVGSVVDPDGEQLVIVDRDGRDRLMPHPELHLTVHAPDPGILPEPGDLLLVAEVAGETYSLFAGATGGCPHAVEFDVAFDDPRSIVGVEYGGLGDPPTGFRLPKATNFRAVDPPDYRDRWYDYRVVFCLNDAGEVVDAQLFGGAGGPTAALVGSRS